MTWQLQIAVLTHFCMPWLQPSRDRESALLHAVELLQAEKEGLRAKVDDLAKRLSAVEDYSVDDEAQNMLLRR